MATRESGGRVFVANGLPRKGLQSGDVVALALASTGEFLAATKVGYVGVPTNLDTAGTAPLQSSSSASSVPPSSSHYTLIPTKKAGADDEVVFLEVVRSGPWLGFKSWAAGNALLQARKKGTHRLTFFSSRFGIYEQWSCDGDDGEALDRVHWASTVVTLRNRKVPSVVLKVQLHRVGVCHYTGAVAVEDSPIPGATGAVTAANVASRTAEKNSATQSIQTMSSMMVQEWIKFVEKEKARRARLQAKVDKATEDVEGLRKWAAQQIQCARQDVQEEIELLLDTLNDRNAALADVRARLDTRIQWGAALLEAKKAMILGRRVLLAWKAKTARAKYCDAVVSKLRKRSQIRAALHALESWRDEVERRNDLQKRLRVGVRRMSYLKMQSSFSAWRRISYDSHELARYEAARNQDASLIAESQRAKGAFAAWRKLATRSKEARRLLGFAANRYREKVAASALEAWKRRVQHVNVSSNELKRRVMLREKARISSVVLGAWRLAVDDGHGEKIEHDRSVAFDVKKTLKKSILAWKHRVEEAKEIELEAELARLHRDRTVGVRVLAMWRQHALEEASTRDSLVGFVHERALRCMQKGLWFWKEHASFKRRTEVFVQQAEARRDAATLHQCVSMWRAHTLEQKIHRRYVKICTERRQVKQAKTVFTAWRAANRRSNKTFSGLLEYADVWAERRMRTALTVLRTHAAEKARERALDTKAINWYAGRLSARVLWALRTEVDRQRHFLGRLQTIEKEHSRSLKRLVWNMWQYEVEETTGREAHLRNFQQRKAWHTINQAFLAWRNINAEEKFLNSAASARRAHIDSMRAKWALGVWRDTAHTQIADRLQSRKADNWHRFKMAFKMFRTWKAQKEAVQGIQCLCNQRFAMRQQQMKHELLLVWQSTAEYRHHLRSVMLTITNARALEMQQSVFNAWREKRAASRAKSILVLRAVNKLSELRARQAFEHWRLVVDDSTGKTMYLNRMEALVDRKYTRSTLKTVFGAWQSRCVDIKAGLKHFEERDLAKLAVLRSSVFSTWKYQTDRAVPLREKAVTALVQRRSSRLMIQAFVSWRHETITQSRNGLVMLHAIDRLSFRMMKEAMFAWRIAAVERKRRRDVMVSLLEQSFKRRLGMAFYAWRNQVAEDIRIRQNLERCITQKRVAYELYRESYWETVDDELQETLRAMFREAETDDEDVDLSAVDLEDCHGIDADDVHASSELFCQSVECDLECESQNDDSRTSDIRTLDLGDLDEIAAAFEEKRRELSRKVREAVQRGQESPGHAMTPPKRELHVLEPLNQFFSSRMQHDTPMSGADSLSLSISSLDSLVDTDDLEDFEDWSSYDGDQEGGEHVECDESVLCPKLAGAGYINMHQGSRKMLFDLGVVEEPESPRILAGMD